MIKMRRIGWSLLGAAGMYFLDPSSGKRRRASTRERLKSRLAESRRKADRQAADEDARRRGEWFVDSEGDEVPRRDASSVPTIRSA
jgi:hypothetical protein